MTGKYAYALAGIAALLATTSQGQETATSAAFNFQGVAVNITQSPTPDLARLAAISGRPADCVDICLSPLSFAEGVRTIAEGDVLAFIEADVILGTGLLIDGRAQDARDAGMIATSVNLPAGLLDISNPYQTDILVAMGARSFNGVLNFADAMPVIVYDNGPLARDAQSLIAGLLEAGYPAEKIQYYRGGLQVWTALGLSVEETAS